MERLRQLAKSSAHDECGYGSVNHGNVHSKADKKPWTTYAPGVVSYPIFQHSTWSRFSGFYEFCDEGYPRKFASSWRFPERCRIRTIPEVELSVLIQERGSSPYTPLNRVYAIKVVFGVGPGGQAAIQAGKPGSLEVLRQDVDAFGRETRELHRRIDHRVPTSALKELRQDTLSHEVQRRMSSYEPQGYSNHSADGYGSCGCSCDLAPPYSLYKSHGYQPVFQSQAPPTVASVVRET
ncbi:Hypothetical protein PHPALM_36477 [Phytophthora palmivora]|uniref:Uncharacterized protein n=1 Tax=Phytophthora palmivora TaxID=4796 RepID=A0A2P4WZU7_9STRA|nr:Hypothetical protein PHPALM_36477 [Phytophthora palmivora]